ncbi:NADP-specific glutamate dehydrogenase [Vagococcus sp. PNs007]|uniref:Glutamate dehydrogenase n=1 Tax=Vagococcus proximus TaxID=2991417 RepID=A0ABT5X376_9ENTE|nr:NADP-specific glutamate dehydrogenase [Vagococcus proximus]MDF0480451.1 NADP-specific glutamate dehydrogenase [Vagococcus proximus]
MEFNIQEFMNGIIEKNPTEVKFHQAVRDTLTSLVPIINENPIYCQEKILERLIEPERTISFRVPWVDDKGEIQINRGWRVQFSSSIGPFKGGIRFAEDVNLDTIKFLGFEMVLKNGLTTLPLGGSKGGADFDSSNKSDAEIMRFCQSFMTELYRYIGPNTDIPAGDLGVGYKEIGYLFGQYKRLANEFTGTITGKKHNWGGSLIRPEATGYGVAYFIKNMLENTGQTIENKRVSISGYGNVGAHLVEKLDELGAKVVTASDPYGYIYDSEGITGEKIEFLKELWIVHRSPIKKYAEKYNVPYYENMKPWREKVDIAIPSSKENELTLRDSEMLVENSVLCVCEAANMPVTEEAVKYLKDNRILFAPGKAANAGGVAVSGLEMSQNAMHCSWSADEVDDKLKEIMSDIHKTCLKYGSEKDGWVNYVDGANIGSFIKVADSILSQGVV